jgi:hypothetical protein
MPSTVIAHIDYQAKEKLLKIVFLSGAVYAYYQVPETVYISMKKARSKGQFLNERIKGKYDFKKIKEPD